MAMTDEQKTFFMGSDKLARFCKGGYDWIWEGFVAREMLSLMTSRWRIGKSTLVAQLLDALEAGGTVAGGKVVQGLAVVISEETMVVWTNRVKRRGKDEWGPHIRWRCRPFHKLPSADEWDRTMKLLKEMRPTLLVVDTLGNLLPPGTENNAASILGALRPLRELADQGSAVLLTDHPPKRSTRQDQEPRGSGALPAFVDILIDLARPRNARVSSRVRVLRVESRLTDAFERWIELNPEGSDYAVLPETAEEQDGFEAGWAVLKTVLEDSETTPTRLELLKLWPIDHAKPSPATLHRWLERAFAEGRLERTGLGRTRHPFRFALPNKEEASERGV